jgi:hypothetical protein
MNDQHPSSEFAKAALEQPTRGLLYELWDFLRTSKKWWLMPILVALLLLGALIIMSGTAAAPFIYTLF